MADSTLNDRARMAEDDYFRRKDAELLERARAARPQPVDPVLQEERRKLGEALGLHQLDVIVPLHTAGIRADTSDLIEWLPAVEVAWIDSVETSERDELQRRFAEAQMSGDAADLLREWLFVRPPHEAMLAAKRALRHRLESSGPETKRKLLTRIVERCEAVGRASGGFFGLGALSLNERARIDDIREGLGDEPAPGQPLSDAIPH